MDRTRLARTLRQAVWASFLAVGFLTFFYVAWAHTSATGWQVGALLVGIIVTSGLASSDLLESWLRKPNGFLDGRRTLALVFVAGIALRLVWYAFVPPVFYSDTLSQWSAAAQLVDTGEVSFVHNGHKLMAWRPPGYAFVLAALIRVFGQASWIPALIALGCYVITFFGVEALATMTVGKRAARVAAAAIAFWPSTIAISVNAASDPLSLLLVTVAVFAFLRSIESGPGWACLAGVAVGYGALVQPTLLTLPALWFVFALLEPVRAPRILAHAVIGLVLAGCIVGPWTLRNYRTLGAFVPVSTNGGDVFYRANNPEADGGYSTKAERDLGELMHDEVAWNRTGFKWGLEWIARDPVAFLRMVPRKQGLLLGEDAFGFYYTLNWPVPNRSRTYGFFAVVSDLWWLGVWIAAVAATLRHRTRVIGDARLSLILLVFLSVVAAHSVFESQSRHHMRVAGLLSVVSSLAFVPRSVQSEPEVG